MRNLLEYGRPAESDRREPNPLASWAMVFGVCSGPISVLTMIFSGHPVESPHTWITLTILIPLVAAFLFGCAARKRATVMTHQDRTLASIGIKAPNVWGLIIIVFIQFVLHYDVIGLF